MNSKPLPKIQSFLKELKRNQPAGKKQTLQEWSMAGGGVPTQYKGREHVWHAKVNKFAEGGEVHMGAGGFLKGLAGKAADAAKAARKVEAPAIIIPSKVSNVKEAVRQSKGDYGARRVERAAELNYIGFLRAPRSFEEDPHGPARIFKL